LDTRYWALAVGKYPISNNQYPNKKALHPLRDEALVAIRGATLVPRFARLSVRRPRFRW